MPTDVPLSGREAPAGIALVGASAALGAEPPATSRSTQRAPLSSANLLLNCLFHADLKAAADLARRLGRADDGRRLTERVAAVAAPIRDQCWDPRDACFYTVDVQCVDRRAELIKSVRRGMDMSWHSLPLRVQTFTGFPPPWCGAATPEQAQALVRGSYLADDRLRAAWGVQSLSSRERMYSLAFGSNPSNWLGPVWIIVNYPVWRGLTNFGFGDLADELRDKTLRLLFNSLATAGSLNE